MKIFSNIALIVIALLSLTDMTPDEYRQWVAKEIDKVQCIKCRTQFKYEEEVQFELFYSGDSDYGVGVGIKIFTDKGWEELIDNINIGQYEGWSKSMVGFQPGKTRSISWNKQTFADEEYNYDTAPPEIKNFYYDISKGARLKLYLWNISPLEHGIQRDLHEFKILPEKK